MASLSSSLAHDETAAPPTLETLIQHLLAAKRSLGCVEHVSRANSLATSTRQVLEQHTIQNARAQFLHAGSLAQTQVLEQIQQHAQGVFQNSISDFNKIMQGFETAEARLTTTLDQLRGTIVEKSLRPKDEVPKSLADFVDESGVERLRATVQESIDTFGEARHDFEKSTADFDEEVTEVRDLLANEGQAESDDSTQDSRAFPLTAVLQRMEIHAHEMASNLESLVKHFDLCITAIRHTDGGGATANEITRELPEGLRQQLEQSGVLEPIDPDDRQEMLDVLMKDAGEVDEVVDEIKNSLSEMESEYERVEQYAEQLSERTERTASMLRLLDDIGHKLPKYVTQSQLFLIRWEEEKAKIGDLMAEFSSLGEFYAEFLAAYNSLIIEVGRRKDTERRMAKVRADAVAKIDKMLAEEQAERMHFRQAQGDFLPVDIWPGLMTAPSKWQFTLVEGTEDSVPDISASTITRAIRGLERSQRSGSSKEGEEGKR
jgi:autophagy-related protein 17